MVKLEDDEGRSVFVSPDDVKSISRSGVEGCCSVVTTKSFFVVKGTPDEVHAKMFPPNAQALYCDVQAANDVVIWMSAQTAGQVAIPYEVISRARKALGREGA